MKNLLLFTFLLFAQCSVFAQSLEWAYSFKNQTVLEEVTDVSSNGSNRFAIIGNGNSGISMDPINLSSTYNSQGNFVASYNELAQIQWIQPTQGFTFGVKLATNGDVFVVGGFTGTKDFDPSSNSFPLTATGYDTYLQKFNADGTFAWAANASADGNPSLIEILADGRIIVVGRSDANSTVTLSNSTTVNLMKGAYLLEFNSLGSFTNAYSISVPASAGYIYVYDITSDVNNNIYLAGSLDGVADFDLGSATSNNAATNAYDAYVVKYNSTFDLQWFRKFGDSNNPTGWDKARALAVDAAGNVFAAGEFTWTTDFNPATPGTFTLVSDVASQVPSGFILQWDAAGTLNWVKKIGNTNSGAPTDFASVSVLDIILQNNVLYTAMEGHGYWDVDPSVGSLILNVGTVSSPGVVFAKYSDNGSLLNAFSIDTSGTSAGLNSVGIGMLGADKFVTSGTFYKRIDFDPSPNNAYLQTDVAGANYNFDKDLYIAKYSFGINTALHEVSENKVVVYPNPFNEVLNVYADSDVASINIYNNLGQLVLTVQNSNARVNTLQLANGMYVVEVKLSNGSIAHKTLVK